MIKVVIDYETRSDIDLKKVGAIKYAKHPATEIICIGYKIGDAPAKLWAPLRNDSFPSDLYEALISTRYKLVAHNALFEQCITRWVLPRQLMWSQNEFIISPTRWKCTAAKSAACALPRSLEGAGDALKLTTQKDKVGSRLIKKYMKPTVGWTKWKKGGCIGKEPKKYYDDWVELEAIYDYCLTDVDTEALLDETLPDLIPYEQEVWVHNQKMNLQGVQIDLETVRHVLNIWDAKVLELQESVREVTNGELNSVLQVKKLTEWFRSRGADFSNLRAQTVKDALKDETLDDDVKHVLKVRAAVSKSSIKKYRAMVTRADSDGRVRDLTLYHGAAPGRESGRGLQPHNFPRGTVKDTNFAIDIIKECDSIDELGLFYRSPAEVLSSCLRGMITASPKKILNVADLNAIECRVLNWFANQQDVLKDFSEGKDPYKKMSSRIFNIDIDDVDDDQRFLGKTAELGCGYQMGKDRFYETCTDWGVPNVDIDLASRAVDVYRESHQFVVKLWGIVERAAIAAVERPNTRFTIRANPDAPITFLFEKKFLWCILPSGRRLSFPFATVRNSEDRWGRIKPTLYYWRVAPQSQKWVETGTYGGSLVESICQATARDITVNGIMNITNAGYNYLFQVHDEIISENDEDKSDIEEYCNLFTTLPAWAKGLPTKAGGWTGFRYKK